MPAASSSTQRLNASAAARREQAARHEMPPVMPNAAPQTLYAPGAPSQTAYASGAAPQPMYAPGAPQTYYAPGAPQTYYAPGAPQTYYAPGAAPQTAAAANAQQLAAPATNAAEPAPASGGGKKGIFNWLARHFTEMRWATSTGKDLEGEPGTNAVDYQVNQLLDRQMRNQFVRKVCLLVMIMLAVTAIFPTLCNLNPRMNQDILRNPGISSAAAILLFILSVACFCIPKRMLRKTSFATSYLCAISLLTSVAVSYLCVIASAKAILIAFFGTAVLFALLVGISFTKYDFTAKGTYLFVVAMLLMLGSVLALCFRSQLLFILTGFGFVILEGIYIIYDLQLIVGGKHRQFEFSVDDWAIATLCLYTDIIDLFIHILQCAMLLSDDD